MNKINETEQWLLNGNCSKCRRNEHCSKPCTKNKRRTHSIMRAATVGALDNVTGGAYSEVMSRVGSYY